MKIEGRTFIISGGYVAGYHSSHVCLLTGRLQRIWPGTGLRRGDLQE